MRDLYVEKFLQSFTKAKRNYVLDLVTKASGDKPIPREELTRRVSSLLNRIDSTNDSPTSVPFVFEEGGSISASVFQGYMRSLGFDAYTLVNGLIQVGDLNDAHKILLTDVLLKSLETELNDIESRVQSAELIASDSLSGFTSSFPIDFSNVGLYQEFNNTDMLFDDYTGSKLSPSDIIEVNGGMAAYLPKRKNSEIVVSDVYLKFPESSVSQVNLQVTGSDLSKIIDDATETFYAESVINEEQIEGGAVRKIALELDGDFFISSVVLDPVGKIPCYVEKVSFDNRNLEVPVYDQDVVVFDTDLLENRVKKRTIIDFERVRATHVYITLRQDTYAVVNVNTDDDDIVVNYSEFSDYNYNFGPDFEEIKNMIIPDTGTNAVSTPYYRYDFGMAEVSVFDSLYNERGFYISPARNMTDVLSLGIDRSFTTNDSSAVYDYAVEHMVSLSVDTNQGTKLGLKFPLMPIGSTEMIEKIRISNSGEGKLYYPVESEEDIIAVYINDGLTLGYAFDPTDNTINITDNALISSLDVITVVYTPVFIKYPNKKYRFSYDGQIELDIDDNGVAGIDERFMVVLYNSTNTVSVRHRVLMRTFQSKQVKLNSLNLLYSLKDPNKYRGL
jgi:hypothetical protein